MAQHPNVVPKLTAAKPLAEEQADIRRAEEEKRRAAEPTLLERVTLAGKVTIRDVGKALGGDVQGFGVQEDDISELFGERAKEVQKQSSLIEAAVSEENKENSAEDGSLFARLERENVLELLFRPALAGSDPQERRQSLGMAFLVMDEWLGGFALNEVAGMTSGKDTGFKSMTIVDFVQKSYPGGAEEMLRRIEEAEGPEVAKKLGPGVRAMFAAMFTPFLAIGGGAARVPRAGQQAAKALRTLEEAAKAARITKGEKFIKEAEVVKGAKLTPEERITALRTLDTEPPKIVYRDAISQEYISARSESTRPEFFSPVTDENLDAVIDAGGKVRISADGTSGYILTAEGDLQGLFNVGAKGAGRLALKDAIAQGANSLDAFDGYLPGFYKSEGFEEVGRAPFNPKLAPDGWNVAKDGTPDIIFMKLTAGGEEVAGGAVRLPPSPHAPAVDPSLPPTLGEVADATVKRNLPSGEDAFRQVLALGETKLSVKANNQLVNVGAALIHRGFSRKSAFDTELRAVLDPEIAKMISPDDLEALFSRSQAKYSTLVNDFAVAEIPGVAELTRLFHAGEHNMRWYDNWRPWVERTLGTDPIKLPNGVLTNNAEMFTRFVAATSPQIPVTRNIPLAKTAFIEWKTGVPFSDQLNIKNLERVAKGLPFSDDSPKVNSFYLNAWGDQNAVTGDGWIAELYGFEKTNFKQGRYTFVQESIRQQARVAEVQPRQFQAALWVASKVQKGVPEGATEDFATIAQRVIDENPSEYADLLSYQRQLGLESVRKGGLDESGRVGLPGVFLLARAMAGSVAAAKAGDEEDMLRNGLIGAGLGALATPKVMVPIMKAIRKQKLQEADKLPFFKTEKGRQFLSEKAMTPSESSAVYEQGLKDFEDGTRTFDEVFNEAELMSNWGFMDPDKIRAIQQGEILNDGKTVALSLTMMHGWQRLQSLANSAKRGKPGSFDEMMNQLGELGSMDVRRLSNKKEQGRSLNINNLTEEKFPQLGHLRDLMSRIKADQSEERIAELILNMEGPNETLVFARMAANPKFKDMLIEAWVNGILSGTKTLAVNATGNPMFLAQNIFERGMTRFFRAPVGKEAGVASGEAWQMMVGVHEVWNDALRAGWRMAKSDDLASKFFGKLDQRKRAITTENVNDLLFMRKMGLRINDVGPIGRAIDWVGTAFTKAGGVAENLRSPRGLFVTGRAVAGGAVGAEGSDPEDVLLNVALGAAFGGAASGKNIRRTGELLKSFRSTGTIVRAAGRALISTDEFFKTLAYRAELRALVLREATADIAAQGLKGQDAKRAIDAKFNKFLMNPSVEARDKASEFALYATFVKELGPAGKALKILTESSAVGKVTAPFITAPGNLFKVGFLERTPLAFLTKDFRNAMTKGGADAEIAMTRMAVGSMMMAMFSSWAVHGFITGSESTNFNAVQIDRDNGRGAESFNVTKIQRYFRGEVDETSEPQKGDHFIKFGRFDPLGQMMVLAANFARISSDLEDADIMEYVGALAVAGSKMFASRTWVRGGADALMAVTDPERRAAHTLQRLVGTAVPQSSALATITREIDPVIRQAESIQDEFKKKSIFFSDQVKPSRDMFANVRLYPPGFGPDFLSPAYSNTFKDHPVLTALHDDQVAIGNPPDKIFGIQLTPKEHEQYEILSGNGVTNSLGQTYEGAMIQVIADTEALGNTSGPDSWRAAKFVEVTTDYRRRARVELLKKFPDLARDVQAAENESRKALGIPITEPLDDDFELTVR